MEGHDWGRQKHRGSHCSSVTFSVSDGTASQLQSERKQHGCVLLRKTTAGKAGTSLRRQARDTVQLLVLAHSLLAEAEQVPQQSA